MESYRILPLNCAHRKVLQLVGIKTARIRRCRATFCELVHLCKMVEYCPRASTSEGTLFSENADPLRQRAVGIELLYTLIERSDQAVSSPR